jgi:hypothetical protein
MEEEERQGRQEQNLSLSLRTVRGESWQGKIKGSLGPVCFINI